MENIEIALRCFADSGRGHTGSQLRGDSPDFKRILVFDTETRTDCYMNLTFGSCSVYQYGKLAFQCIFYGELSDSEIVVMQKFASSKGLTLMHVREFVDRVFLPEVYNLETPCVGFNLPFDLSRLAISYGYARGRYYGGFSFKMSHNPIYPHLVIKHLDSKRSFTQFTNACDKKGNLRGKNGQTKSFRGHFLDLRTMAFALTDQGHSLSSACQHFRATVDKTSPEDGHGRVTEKYVQYNLNDVEASYQLFLRMLDEYRKYHIGSPPMKLFSPASIGKAYLDAMGILPFFDKNPEFPMELLGHLMATYYGGRAEVKVRKTPMEVALIDFLSMYPTMCGLQDIWSFVIAERIEWEEATKDTIHFIETITLEDLRNPRTWKRLSAICLIEPNDDILPVRSKYGDKHTFNIGLNFLTSDQYIWYTLADVLASKILTGKTPKIVKVIQFIPVGKQEDLSPIKLIGDRRFDPNDEDTDFFMELMQYRHELKTQRDANDRDTNFKEYERLDTGQRAVKILANSTSYGIFIELNSMVRTWEGLLTIYGNNGQPSELKIKKVEESGRLFHPLIATMVTSAARLALAITEAILAKHGATYAFCDTDSMAIPPEHVEEVQAFFRGLSPYSFTDELFKLEKENFDEGGNLKPLWFYGVSAKRYVLYNMENGTPVIRKASSHGLGHLLNPFQDVDDKKWHEAVWKDILDGHYGLKLNEDILLDYQGLFAISKLAITTPHIMKRFKGMNEGKDHLHQIKPFNFMLVGTASMVDEGTMEPIKPIAPFNKRPQSIVDREFIDYESGQVLQGMQFWKEMVDIFCDYRDHSESKFEGDVGVLQRRHLRVKSIVHIGKESNNLEQSFAFGVTDHDYCIYSDRVANGNDNIKRFINQLDIKAAEKCGIGRRSLDRWKEMVANDESVNLNSLSVKKLDAAMRLKKLKKNRGSKRCASK